MILPYLSAGRAFGVSLVLGLLPNMVSAKPKPGLKSTPSKEVKVAEMTASKTAAVEKKGGVAQIRVWKAIDMPDQTLQVHFSSEKSSDLPAAPKLDTNSYQFSNYATVPAGPLIAELATADKTLTSSTYLAPDGLSTLLIRRVNGNLSAEWIDDTVDSADGGCEFSVFNLLPSSGDIQVSVGEIFSTHLPTSRSNARVRGLKKANYTVVVNGTDGNGKNFHWDTQADFRQCRRASLLIYPDLYGRIRPRLNAQ